MTEKPKISLSIMPTYKCNNNCNYCYLQHKPFGYVYYDHGDSDALIRKIYKRLKELSAKYTIETVEMYGGDLDAYDERRLKILVEAYRCYCTNDRIMLRDMEKAKRLGFKPWQVNVSINPERADFLQNLGIIKKYPNVGVITVVTKMLMNNPLPEIFDWFLNFRGNLTFMPYSNTSPNYPIPYVSNYEYCAFMIQLLEYYLENRERYKFKVTNITMLKDCVNEMYSPAMRNNIFLEPSGHFACVDFDINGHEFFKTFDKLEKWESRCKQEEFDRASQCGTCEYFRTCMAEHFKRNDQLPWFTYENGDICNGYKPLVDWAKEHLNGFSY